MKRNEVNQPIASINLMEYGHRIALVHLAIARTDSLQLPRKGPFPFDCIDDQILPLPEDQVLGYGIPEQRQSGIAKRKLRYLIVDPVRCVTLGVGDP